MTILMYLIGLLTVLFLSCMFTMLLQEKTKILVDFLLQIAMNNELGIGTSWKYDEETQEWFIEEKDDEYAEKDE